MAAGLLSVQEQDLLAFNTLGLASRARHFVRLQSDQQISALLQLVQQYLAVFVLGGGSNVVLAPQLASLLVKVETRGIRLVQQTASHYVVEAAAGENWHHFVQFCLQQGWPGLENLALIPGTVGAAPVQNIGAYGVELDQRLHSLVAWNVSEQKRYELLPHECGFAYRDSVFKQAGAGQWLISAVRFSLPKVWQPQLAYPDLARHPVVSGAAAGNLAPQQVFDAVCEIRHSKLPDPAVLPNAGSFFKNPVVVQEQMQALRALYPDIPVYALSDGSFKLAAAWLIDQAGWKGRQEGCVGVHQRQALVLVNYGGAQASDIQALADAIKADVLQRFGVTLEQEPVPVF